MNASPMIKMIGISYHYHRDQSNSEGNSSGDQKLISNEKEENLLFSHSRDISEPLVLINSEIIKIYVEKTFISQDQNSASNIQKQIQSFRAQYESQDKYFSFCLKVAIPGSQEKYLCFQNNNMQSESKFSLWLFILLSIFGMSTCYLLWFEKQCSNQNYKIVKSLVC